MPKGLRFIGGRGYCAKLLFDELPPGTGPLGTKNIMLLGAGPITGTPVSGNSRYVIVTKSPATNLFLDTYAGGFFPAEMKFAGYNFIIIKGKAVVVEDEVANQRFREDNPIVTKILPAGAQHLFRL